MKKKLKYIITSLLTFITAISLPAQRLVLPGDHPDPSVTKIGDSYWASATTSNWMPAYPLLESSDLVNWTPKGYVFNELPEWADYYFWAPEITYENGKVYVYYAAHKKKGNLCLGIASADKPEGPYKDHGPMMCQEVGSIDAYPMRDENGKLYLIWKEDANSVNKPTPIWIMEMNEERTKLIGEKKELFRNSLAWEENLVEGVSMIKHGEYYYALYAASGCCGAGCKYVVGVARSKKLLGPWEKDIKNPVLKNNGQWICPGHGTAIEKDGRFYFLHHAYDKKTAIFTGRQGILSEFKFTPDNWIEFVNDPVSVAKPAPVQDDFKGDSLLVGWEWSVFENINYKLKGGSLQLSALAEPAGAFIGQKTRTGDYTAITIVNAKRTNATAGLAAIGDEKNVLSILATRNKIKVVALKNGIDSTIAQNTKRAKNKIYLKMQVKEGRYFTYSYSTNGNNYSVLNKKPIDGIYLPPWDRGLRAGLISKGNPDQEAVFESFKMIND